MKKFTTTEITENTEREKTLFCALSLADGLGSLLYQLERVGDGIEVGFVAVEALICLKAFVGTVGTVVLAVLSPVLTPIAGARLAYLLYNRTQVTSDTYASRRNALLAAAAPVTVIAVTLRSIYSDIARLEANSKKIDINDLSRLADADDDDDDDLVE